MSGFVHVREPLKSVLEMVEAAAPEAVVLDGIAGFSRSSLLQPTSGSSPELSSRKVMKARSCLSPEGFAALASKISPERAKRRAG